MPGVRMWRRAGTAGAAREPILARHLVQHVRPCSHARARDPMKAIQLVHLKAPLEARDVPTPSPGAGEVLVAVEAAGICHSDVHYRDGTSAVARLPITPGHEIAGSVAACGADVTGIATGQRVAVHYLATCGVCDECARGREQFCARGQMFGKHRDGGYAEFVAVPAQNLIPVPDEVDPAVVAIMMCSTATAFHALRKARLAAGESVAVFGAGGLGLSAIRLARACGASGVFAIDIDAGKREQAERAGAVAIDPAVAPPASQLRDATGGRGVDVALEFTGLAAVQQQAFASLAVQGRAALAGIGSAPFQAHAYPDVINREIEIVGVSDHLRSELATLMAFARRGVLDLGDVIEDRIPLDADEINRHLDALAAFRGRTRTVITPRLA